MSSLVQWLIDIIRGLQVWVTVLPWERCVRVRLGKYATELDPGYHWKWPWVDQVWPINNRLRFASFPVQSLTTKDNKPVHVAGLVKFRIIAPLKAMMSLVQPENSVAAIVQTVVADYVKTRNYDELDPTELEALALAQLIIDADGFLFECVAMTDWTSGRSFRLFQESWRPETRPDHDPYAK